MVSGELSATPKGPDGYVKNTWAREDSVAGGFWVDDFDGIGSGKQVGALAMGITRSTGILV
jgi:hypothetical protein